MSDSLADQALLRSLRSGSEDAAAVLFSRYQARLLALIRARLSRKLARRVDPEDILLSAYRSFFVAARGDRIALAADADLWPLLTTVVLRKLAHQARRHAAGCRTTEQEEDVSSAEWEAAIGRDPTAEHAALFADELEQLIARLDDTGREVLVQTLQGHDVASIAVNLGINERSVRRALDRIRAGFPKETAHGGDSILIRQSRENLAAKVAPILWDGTTSYDQYQLKEFVGAGAFSKVYRALDRSSGQIVAVKYLRKQCWHDARATASLIREFEILQRLNHPRILAIRGWGKSRLGVPFLVTEFIRGRNLADWCHQEGPDLSRLLGVITQVTDAVGAAHAQGVLHSDLKPANVMIRDDGQAVLCDFGLARSVTDPDDLPRGGTAGFLAPEQISEAFGPVTTLTDIYGLGALVYAVLTDRPPFIGRDLPETLANVLSASLPDPPSRHSRHSTPELDDVILRCLAKEPAQRYSTVSAVLQALTNLTH